MLGCVIFWRVELQRNIIIVCNTSHHVWTKQSPFLHVPYIHYSSLSHKWALYRHTIITYINGTEVDKHAQSADITHTLMALDLIFLLLSICAERRDALKKIAERDPFSLMKWKACVGAICQSNQRFNGGSDERGDFFFHCVTSQITWEEYKERNGVTMDGWGFYTEILITFRRRKETMGSGFLFVKLCSHFNSA